MAPERICPHCKKTIHDDEALLCLYCGESLGCEAGFLGKMRRPRPAILIAILALLVLFALLVAIIR